MIKLYESRDISKGIFWVVWIPDIEDIDDGHVIALPVYCDRDGNVLDDSFIGNSKDGTNNTHKNTWEELVVNQHKLIRNKDWNYFPRGRVEISHNTINIFVNPNIEESIFKKDILKEFNLLGTNMQVNWHVDGSEHYKCYLDRG